MDPFIVTLVLSSTFMHAGWNLIAQRERSEADFFYKMLTVVALAGFIPGMASEFLVPLLPMKAWLCVIGSGIFCGMYFYFLARSYGSSDFTTVYPLARALPVLVVGIGDVLRGRYPTVIGWGGMLLICLGCFLAPLNSFGEFSIRSYLNRRIFWMLLTALGTVGYTILDKIAAEIIPPGPVNACRYGYLFFLFSFLSYLFLYKYFRQDKEAPVSIAWQGPVLAGCLCFVAYCLVLWAFQTGQHASYIIAFRQFSIVIGIAIAFKIYNETVSFVRISAIALITTGLVLIGIGGG